MPARCTRPQRVACKSAAPPPLHSCNQCADNATLPSLCVQVGTLYSMADGRKTLQNVFALDLFDNVQVSTTAGLLWFFFESRPDSCVICSRVFVCSMGWQGFWECGGGWSSAATEQGKLAGSGRRQHSPQHLLSRPAVAAHSPTHPRPASPLLQILPRQNEKDLLGVDVEVLVREKPMQTADVEAEWSIAPGAQQNA